MPTRCIQLFYLLLITACAGLTTASETDPLRQQFLQRQQETKTWSAEFTQTLTMPGLREPVVSKGTLAYRIPGQLTIDYAQPRGESVLVIGDQVYIKKPGADTDIKSLSQDWEGKPFQMLLGFLSGQPQVEEKHYRAEVTRQPRHLVVELIRQGDESAELPKRIANRIDSRTLEIDSVHVDLPNGGSLGYHFTFVTRNRPVDGARFQPPEAR